MTVKEAFAQAFNEAFVMDSAPSGLSTNPGKAGGTNSAKAARMGSGMAAAAKGAEKSMGSQKSLAEHLQEGCEAEKNGHPERCPYVQRMAKDFEKQGMSHEEAQKKALQEHASAAMLGVGGAPQGEGQQPQGGMQQQQKSPAVLEQQTQQIAQNPQMMEQIPSEMLPETKQVQTEAGEIPAQTTVQAGILENLTEQAASGNTIAEEALNEIKDKVEDGTITQGGEQQPVVGTPEGEEQTTEPSSENPGRTPVEQTARPKEYISTSDGKRERELEEDEAMVLAANPEKRDLLQKMVDVEAKVSGLDSTSPELKDLANQYMSLKRMFFGEDAGVIGEGTEGGNEGAGQPKPITGESGGGGSGDGGTPPPTSVDNSAPSNGENPSETPSQQEGEQQTNQGETTTAKSSPPPSDEEFRIGKNKYQVGGNVYTDVSGKGLLRTMISSFMAGLRGEGIITGWDRISGAWDQMKRSENGEMVRDGIAGALIKNTIDTYAAKEGLSPDAKMELAVIQDMVSQAKTPKDNMAAVKQFQAWKEKYAKELGEMDKPKLGEPFKPLPNDYKGGKPPISILDAPKDFEADKDFGDKVATVLQESLGAQGLPVGDIESISVGPSATTIEFRVDPTFNITEAKSKKVLEALHGALGSPVSNMSWVTGKPHVIAVQVTNQKMRDVSFSSCIASDEWKNFAEKAGLPVTLGKDSSGKNVNLDLAKQPHTIVTGESGSGKSVFLMAAINSLEMAKTPDEARLVLLDPKNEFRSQDGSPHLLYPRAQKAQDIANVVSSLKALMDDRIAKIGGVVKDFDPTKNEFQGNSDRNITEYNKLHPEEKMPHVLLTFDEVASIMKNPDVSDRVKQDLSQIMALGRSVGINCLLATQRADVASIPGDIKANAPASIAFKAAPDDAKASAAAKSLAGSGDFIMTDKEGKQTRGRGCFISDKEVAAVPAYYRDNMNGAPSQTDGGGDSGGGDGAKLPQEHLDAIEAAVENGNPISMVATEGYMDAFKNAFPSDWEITEEEVDGEKHWKASPPSKPTGGTESNPSAPKLKDGFTSVPPPAEAPEYTAIIKDAEGKIVGGIHKDGSRIDFTKNGASLAAGEKAPWESDEPASSEGGGESSATETQKEENTDWRKAGSRDEAVNTLSKVRDKAKTEAWDAYNNGEDTVEAQKKLKKAIEKADVDFDAKMALVNLKFPPPMDDHNEDDVPEGGEEEVPEVPEGSGTAENPAASTMKDIEETYQYEREQIEVKLSKPGTKVRDKQALRKELEALNKRYSEARTKFEDGGSSDDIIDIFEPKAKPTGEAGQAPSEQTEELSDDEKAAAAQQEQAQKDEKLRSTVREQKFYGAPGFRATSKVTPNQIKQMENLLPAGWEFVTDNQFKAPARTKKGVVFIKHPTNGSYGRIFIKKDAKGKEYVEPEAQIDVDTTHPDYQGFVKNEDGSYGLTEEGKKAEAEYKHIRKYSKSEKEKAEVQKKFNRIRFGHDEAPDNRTIVASVVADVLGKLGD